MNKLIKDGQVAVIHAPSFGAGWYTWNREYPELMFDPALATLLIENKLEQACVYAELKWGDKCYLSDVGRLAVKWIPQGVEFRINEYDGSERVIMRNEDEWFIA